MLTIVTGLNNWHYLITRNLNQTRNRKMANNLFADMLVRLNVQTTEQAKLQRELETTKLQLLQKDQLIGKLEMDLEHMVDQFSKISYNNQWMDRDVPGLLRN